MATIRKRLLKNGKSAYDIQVKATDKGSGRQYVRTLCWHPDSDMSDKKADKEVILVADRFEKEVIDSVTGASPAVDPTTISFRAFAEKWLEKVRRDDSVSYYATSRKVLDFAYKSIGGYKLRELTPAILQNFFNSIDGRRRTVTVITPKPTFRNILASYGYKYKNLRHEYHIQPATLSRALNGKPVGAKWALELCRAAKIPFDKLFDRTETQKPYAWETNNKIKRTVRAILALAKKNRLVQDNFASSDYIDYPPKAATPVQFMDDKTAAQFFEFLLTYKNIRIKTAMLILLLTGLRRGELCGLEWSDIDFENKTLTVRRSVVYVSGFGVFEKEPKTHGSKRTIAVSDSLLHFLSEYRIYQADLKNRCGDYMKPSEKLFTSERGELIHPATVETWMKIVLRDSGMSHFTLHSLRHTNITLQIAAGIPLVTVSARAGHSRTSTTGDIYSHVIQSGDRRAAEAIESFFSEPKKENT